MTLLARIQSLQGQLASIGTLQARIEEASRLQERGRELGAERGPLGRTADAFRLLQDGGVRLPPPASTLAQGRRHLGIVRERFAKEGTAESLTRGQDWELLLSRTREGVKETTGSLSAAWRAHVENLFTGERPETVAAQLAQTDNNKAALCRYQVAWQQWRRHANTLPASSAALTEAATAAATLRQIDASFDRDVPLAVKRFLDAVGQGGAGLDLVTDEVREWLRRSGSHSRYRVVATLS